MKENGLDLDQYVGLRLNKNMYNRSGVLVLPAFTVLTRINTAIKEIKLVFDTVRVSEQIPIDSIRDKMVPIIFEMSQHADLKAVLAHMERHDEYTYRHSIGVALIARLIGKTKRLSQEQLEELSIAGFLHDIGKIKIPEEVINKPGKLTKEEFNLVKHHTIFGHELISNTQGMSSCHALVALQHHEREDGSGYPYGIKGADIHPYSKIVAVADVFHAMISRRIYKEPIPFYQVLQIMSQDMYSRLEPGTTLSFLKRMMDLMIGSSVLLSTGVEAKIVMVKPDDPVHPVVEVNGAYIDLSRNLSIRLESIV
jgi:HD-GYP domain-containing protein (c-di-GMP phosphodiesterase class II)